MGKDRNIANRNREAVTRAKLMTTQQQNLHRTALAGVIKKIQGWQQLSSPSLLSKLQEPTVQFVDTRSFTLMGIAGIIGKQNMKPLHQFLESINQDWVFLQAAVGLPIGDPVMNAEIKAIPHPDCQAIAHAGRRMISVLEESGLQPTLQDIADTQASMLLEDRKQSLISQNAVRWNTFCEAVNNWDGISPAPEL